MSRQNAKHTMRKGSLLAALIVLLLAGLAAGLWFGINALRPVTPEKALADSLEAAWEQQDAESFLERMISEEALLSAAAEQTENTSDIDGASSGDLLAAIMSRGKMKLRQDKDGSWQAEFTVPNVEGYLDGVSFDRVISWELLYCGMTMDIQDGVLDTRSFTVPVQFVTVDGQYYLLAQREVLDAMYGGMLTFTENAVKAYYTELLDALWEAAEE